MAEHINVTVHKQELVVPRTVVWKQGAESSSGHYGSWNASYRWVNIWKCRKPDTRLYVDILIKAKGCFGPLSSVKTFILGAKYQCHDIRGLGKSNIMFCNIATANSTLFSQLHQNTVSFHTEGGRMTFYDWFSGIYIEFWWSLISNLKFYLLKLLATIMPEWWRITQVLMRHGEQQFFIMHIVIHLTKWGSQSEWTSKSLEQ